MNRIILCGDNAQLDGRNLIENQLLEIEWPNGRKQFIRVHIIGKVCAWSGGNDVMFTTQENAFFKTRYEGLEIFVPLVGLMARRIDGK